MKHLQLVIIVSIMLISVPLSGVALACTGTGHFVMHSVGYTDGVQPHTYTFAPNFR